MFKYLFLCIPFLLLSCATPQYTIQEGDSLALKNQKISYLRGGKIRLAVGTLEDGRKNKEKLGEVMTGIGNIPTPVVLHNNDLGDFSTRFISQGLIKRGLPLSLTGEADFLLKGKVTDLWLREVATEFGTEAIECAVTMDFALDDVKANREAWNGKMSVNYLHSGKAFDSTSATSEALGACLNQVLEKLIRLKKLQSLLSLEVVK